MVHVGVSAGSVGRRRPDDTMKSVVLVLALMCAGVLANSEHDLARHLLDNYPNPKFVRPVENYGDKVPLKISFHIVNIANMDETNGILTVSGWLYTSWTDPFLAWTPSEHDGITNLQFDSAAIWKPDIRGYFSIKETLGPELAIVLAHGQVIHIPQVTYEVQCSHDHETEICTCDLAFGSWAYHTGLLDLSIGAMGNVTMNGGIGTSFLQESPRWELVSAHGVLESMKYDCCPKEYQSLYSTLQIRKKADEGDHEGHASHEDHHEPHDDSHENHHRH